MKIAILGAGALGSVVGARLALGGAEVTLLDVNEAHVSAVKTQGLKAELNGETQVLKLAASRPEDFCDQVDLVVVLTKSFHTEAALQALSKQLQTACVLSLQNGLGNQGKIEKFVPRDRLFLGVTLTPAEFIAPGHVHSSGDTWCKVYSANGAPHETLDALKLYADRGGLDMQLTPDIHVAIWEKAAFNCAFNAACALGRANVANFAENPNAPALAFDIAQEVITVAKAHGVAADLGRVKEAMQLALQTQGSHEPSMLQDLKAGRRTEIDALNGAVAHLASQKDLKAPLNSMLATLVQLSEAPRNNAV